MGVLSVLLLVVALAHFAAAQTESSTQQIIATPSDGLPAPTTASLLQYVVTSEPVASQQVTEMVEADAAALVAAEPTATAQPTAEPATEPAAEPTAVEPAAVPAAELIAESSGDAPSARITQATPDSVYTPFDRQGQGNDKPAGRAGTPRRTVQPGSQATTPQRSGSRQARPRPAAGRSGVNVAGTGANNTPQQPRRATTIRANQQQIIPVTVPRATAVVAPAAVVAPSPEPALPPFTVDMPSKAVQLSPSVLLMGHFDWEIIPDANGNPWSRCLDMVWRARRLSRGNKLNFVPTHHWMPGSDGFGVENFCYMHKTNVMDVQMSCSPWTAAKIKEFEQSMTLCFAEAMRQGFTLYLRPHLDDGYARGIWRNGLMFGPSFTYGDSYSYKEIMLDPLSKALSAALKITAAEGTLWPQQDKDRPVVYFALQGEMSATIMRYTKDWQALIPGIRSSIGNTYADVKVGVGLNFNALDAVEGSSPSNGLFRIFGSRASRYPVPAIDGAAVNQLFNQDIDFLGVSAYAPYTGPGMTLNEFENSAFNVADSLRSLAGVDLLSLINSGKLELHYSEFGVGGGSEGNASPAASAVMVGKQPWAGVAGFYSFGSDPWMRADLQAFRAEFYTKTLEWLASPNIKTFNVCDVFVWGMASWDLFGVYPDSSTAEGTYRDAYLVQLISRHNTKVIAAQVLEAKGSDVARLAWNQMQEAEAQFASYYAATASMPDASRLAAARTASNEALVSAAGGNPQQGRTPPRGARQAASQPFFGFFG